MALAVAAVFGGWAIAAAEPAAKGVAKAPAEPLERRPYRVRAVIATDPAARLDARRREALIGEWSTLVRRFVGAPWVVEVAAEADSLTPAADPAALKPEDAKALAAGFDKVWVIRVGPQATGSGLLFEGREYDATLGRLGPYQRLAAPVARDAPRAFFRFTLDLFAPYAEFGEKFGKGVALRVQGAAVEAASPVGRVVQDGAVFQPLRVVTPKEGPAVVREIAYTFLRVDAATPTGAKCSVVTVHRNPFPEGQFKQKTALAALGVKPGKSPTRLRFLTAPDRSPAAGYTLTARRYPDGAAHDVGTTDREGRVTLDPTASEADGLLILRLLAGSSEPLIEFPIMPGDDAAERTAPPVDVKPLTVALETRLDSLRDTVIDLVGVRARLESRLKARFDGEDYPGAEEALKEFRALPGRETLADQLVKLKDDAARQQVKGKTAVLTKNAQALLADLQSLIDRYLEDDAFKGYADGLEKIKADRTAAAKAPAKKKAGGAAAPRPGP